VLARLEITRRMRALLEAGLESLIAERTSLRHCVTFGEMRVQHRLRQRIRYVRQLLEEGG